jgi:ubiquinone/menaquinone biosynthesis C-methylase UbiE
MMQTKDIKAFVQQQFEQVAANYVTSQTHAAGIDLAEMVKAAQLTGNERVLDAGCGTGHTALSFAPYVAQVIAVDFTEGMLAQGRKLAAARGITNVEFRLGDVEKLAFRAGEFDLVVTRYSAHHWPHPQRALQEIHRVLKPSGSFILSDVVSFDDPVLDTYVQAIEVLRDPSHVRDHSAVQWLQMLEANGFDAHITYTWDVALELVNWVERMATPAVQVAAIRALFAAAPQEVRTALKLTADEAFAWPGGLFRAVKI